MATKRKERKNRRIEWKVPVSVMLDTTTIDDVDDLAGLVPRSNYLRDLIIKEVKKRKKKK